MKDGDLLSQVVASTQNSSWIVSPSHRLEKRREILLRPAIPFEKLNSIDQLMIRFLTKEPDFREIRRWFLAMEGAKSSSLENALNPPSI